jgi:cell division protein FtsB
MPERSQRGEAGLRQKAAVLTCVIAILALLLNGLFGDRGYLHVLEKRDRTEALAREVDHLDGENGRLALEIQALRTEPGAIEKIAREELGLARPGEKVFLILGDDDDGGGGNARNDEH